MITFTNGPAAGVSLSCVRAPIYLRVVQSRAGQWDALDQVGDTPKATETITAYKRIGSAGSMHLSYRTPSGQRRGRWEAIAEYELCAEQPSDDVARDNEAWRNWATEPETLPGELFKRLPGYNPEKFCVKYPTLQEAMDALRKAMEGGE